MTGSKVLKANSRQKASLVLMKIYSFTTIILFKKCLNPVFIIPMVIKMNLTNWRALFKFIESLDDIQIIRENGKCFMIRKIKNKLINKISLPTVVKKRGVERLKCLEDEPLKSHPLTPLWRKKNILILHNTHPQSNAQTPSV